MILNGIALFCETTPVQVLQVIKLMDFNNGRKTYELQNIPSASNWLNLCLSLAENSCKKSKITY